MFQNGHTEADAFEAIKEGISAIFDKDTPSVSLTTHVNAVNIPVNETPFFAQIVSDCLALMPQSEEEITAIMNVETLRNAGDHRAMTIGELAQRVARLPEYQD